MSIKASDLKTTFEGSLIVEYETSAPKAFAKFTYDKRRSAVGWAEGGFNENMTWHIIDKNTKAAAKKKAVEIYNREYI